MNKFIYGARDTWNKQEIYHYLDSIVTKNDTIFTIEQPGANFYIKQYAKEHNIKLKSYSSLYASHGPVAEDAIYNTCLNLTQRFYFIIKSDDIISTIRPLMLALQREDAVYKLKWKII